MKNLKVWLVCACLVFCTETSYSISKAPLPQKAITLDQVNQVLPQENVSDSQTALDPIAETTATDIPDIEIVDGTNATENEVIAQQTTDDGLLQIKKEEEHLSFIDKTKRYFDAESTENIFGRKEFKKTFETGIIKDIKLIGGHDMALNAFRQSNGISHTVIDDRVSLYGIQGYFRDGTMYNFTFVPFMEHVPNYPNASNRLFEYYLKRKIGKTKSYITVGQQRTPNTLEGCRSVFGLPIGRRAQLGNTYSNITAIGAKVSGDYDRIEYQAGIFDSGRFMKDVFYYQPEFATLVSYKPIKNTKKYGTLRIGGSYNTGRRQDTYSVYSAHALYDYKKAHLDFEYAFANGYSGRSYSKNKSDSFYATFIYKLSPRWEPFLRVDTLNANTRLAGQRNTEYSVGTHYYLKGKKARLTVSYIYANHESRPDSNKLFTMLEVLL